jgi:hypothetical protein
LRRGASNDAFDGNGHLISAAYAKTLQALMDRLRQEIGR